jgi:hypothetical protein
VASTVGQGPAHRPDVAAGDLARGGDERPHGAGQRASSAGRHPVEDLRDRGSPLFHHALDELVTRRGELEQEVAPVGRVVAAVEQTGDDQSVTRPRGVRRVHAHALGDRREVERATAGHHHQQPELRGRDDVLHRMERALTPMSTRAASMTASTSSVASDAALATAPLCTQWLHCTCHGAPH